jgi:uncharacterized membrane protein YeiH
MLGVVTGIGGGMLRDVLVGDSPPHAFRRGAPYASAALAGASLYTGLVIWTEIPDNLIALASMALVVLIRAVGVWRGWVTPGSIDLTPRRRAEDRVDPDLPS